MKPVQRLVERRELASGNEIERMLSSMANQIAERAGGSERLAFVGIRTGGYELASRLRAKVQEILGGSIPLGAVDITLYRDDVFVGLPKPQVGTTELPFDIAGTSIVLVDDVLYTGRTVRAALDALNDFGRPMKVELATLIDRGRRELPIQADYVGLDVETTKDESVKVNLAANSKGESVVLRSLEKAGEKNA